MAQATQQPHQQSRIASSTPTPSFRSSLTNVSSSSTNNTVSYKKSIKSPSTPTHHFNTAWNFNFNEDSILPIQTRPPENIVGIPASAQERVLINELLYNLIGIRGDLIVPKLTSSNVDVVRGDHNQINNYNDPTLKEYSVHFEINEQVQESIKDILMEILPLGNFYYQIQNFVSASTIVGRGQVLGALASALKKLINDYYVSI